LATPHFGAGLRVEVVRGVCASLPFEPELARVLCVEVVFDAEAHVARERLRAVTDDEMAVCVLHHCLPDERRRSHAFERGACGRTPEQFILRGQRETGGGTVAQEVAPFDFFAHLSPSHFDDGWLPVVFRPEKELHNTPVLRAEPPTFSSPSESARRWRATVRA